MVNLLEHFWIKIIAVLLGLLLWFHVATEKDYNYQLNMPVSEVILDSNLTLGEAPPESLMVTVVATGKQLLRQKWRDRGLKIIATQFLAGEHDITLNTSNTLFTTPVTDITLEEVIFPSNITLEIDKISTVTVPVNVDIITETGNEFAIGRISDPMPNQVTLKGPQSIIGKVKSVNTIKKELRGIRNDLQLNLPLVLPEGYGMSLDPDSVLVDIEVVPIKSRKFENIPVVVYNTDGRENITINPETVSVTIVGPLNEIDNLNPNAIIVSTDINFIDEDGKAPLKVVCPAKYNVRQVSTDSVAIFFE